MTQTVISSASKEVIIGFDEGAIKKALGIES